MVKHRTHSIEFKRQVVQDYLGGETLYGLAKRHEISRTLIHVWLAKHEAGVLDSDTAAADMLADYEARIAALERLVGSWRFKSRVDDHPPTRARPVSATPTRSDGARAPVRTRRPKGSLLDADKGSRSAAD